METNIFKWHICFQIISLIRKKTCLIIELVSNYDVQGGTNDFNLWVFEKNWSSKDSNIELF